jgi:hypothetical protein
MDFESIASANSATPAWFETQIEIRLARQDLTRMGSSTASGELGFLRCKTHQFSWDISNDTVPKYKPN